MSTAYPLPTATLGKYGRLHCDAVRLTPTTLSWVTTHTTLSEKIPELAGYHVTSGVVSGDYCVCTFMLLGDKTWPRLILKRSSWKANSLNETLNGIVIDLTNGGKLKFQSSDDYDYRPSQSFVSGWVYPEKWKVLKAGSIVTIGIDFAISYPTIDIDIDGEKVMGFKAYCLQIPAFVEMVFSVTDENPFLNIAVFPRVFLEIFKIRLFIGGDEDRRGEAEDDDTKEKEEKEKGAGAVVTVAEEKNDPLITWLVFSAPNSIMSTLAACLVADINYQKR